MRVTIDITDADIADGVCGNPTDCPVARAARRALGPNTDIAVDNIGIYIGGEHQQGLSLPEPARLFVRWFDNDGTGEPFSFDLEW